MPESIATVPHHSDGAATLRPAPPTDAPLLRHWDTQTHVIVGRDGGDWGSSFWSTDDWTTMTARFIASPEAIGTRP